MGDNLRDISESFSNQQLVGGGGYLCDVLALGVARGIWCAESGPAGCGVTCRDVPCTSCFSQVGPCLPSPLSPPPTTTRTPLPPSLPRPSTLVSGFTLVCHCSVPVLKEIR